MEIKAKIHLTAFQATRTANGLWQISRKVALIDTHPPSFHLNILPHGLQRENKAIQSKRSAITNCYFTSFLFHLFCTPLRSGINLFQKATFYFYQVHSSSSAELREVATQKLRANEMKISKE